MKYQTLNFIFIGIILSTILLIKFSPAEAHEKRFHISDKEKTSQPTQTLNKQDINLSPNINKNNIDNQIVNSVNASKSNQINIIPQSGEIILILMIIGTISLYRINKIIHTRISK